MSGDPKEQVAAGYIPAASALIGLEIADAYRPGVEKFLALAAEMAETLDLADLDPDHADLASVYRLPDGD